MKNIYRTYSSRALTKLDSSQSIRKQWHPVVLACYVGGALQLFFEEKVIKNQQILAYNLSCTNAEASLL